MSDWENEVDAPVIVPTKSTWDDEDAEEDVKDTWDASSDEEEEKSTPVVVVAPIKKKKSPAQAAAERQAAEEKKRKELEEKRAKIAANFAETDEDPLERKRRLQQMEIEADLANANDLFAGISVAKEEEEQESKLEKMKPKTKEQYDEFSSALVALISQHKRTGLYNTFLESFIRELCIEMKPDEIRKVASTLTSLSNEKLKASKEMGKKKKSNLKKTIVVGKADHAADTTDYGASAYDDFDDFM